MFSPDSNWAQKRSKFFIDPEIIPSLSTVNIGFSGGADSVLSAWFLFQEYHFRKHPSDLRLMFLDHGLYPSDSAAESARQKVFREIVTDSEYVRISLHRKFKNVSKVASRAGMNFEGVASRLRHKWFRSVESQGIATGHNLSDWYESAVMRLGRGAGEQALRPYPASVHLPNRTLLYPLCNLTRREVRSMAREAGLEFWEDPANSDLSVLRNRLRSVLPDSAGLRISAAALRQEYRPIPSVIWQNQREIHFTKDEWLGLVPELRLSLAAQILREFGSPGFSASRKTTLASGRYDFPPYHCGFERWNAKSVYVLRRGNRLPVRNPLPGQIVLNLSYGHKTLRKFLREKGFSDRQIKAVPLITNSDGRITGVDLTLFGEEILRIP